MSKLRKEKNCLNCGRNVEEIFCSHCGQKNVETHVNAFHAIGEFIGDYFHADGKFFKSMVPLLFRPGYMTNEYNAGKREKFIHPFRLYIFISIVYFSIAFVTDNGNSPGDPEVTPRISLGRSGIVAFQRTDSTAVQNDSTIDILNERAAKLPATIHAYRDSVKALPASNRPEFRDDVVNRLAIKYKASGDVGTLVGNTIEKFRQALPKLLFFLLPFAALLLKLFYIRRKRYYIDHLVHTLHLHSFIFLLLTLYALINLFADSGIIFFITLLAMLIYFFASMKRVYGQSRSKTFLKGILFSFSYLLCLGCIFAAGFLFIFIYD